MYETCWIIRHNFGGLIATMVVYGTEFEMQEYMRYLFGYIPAYSAATEREITEAVSLGMKIYACPVI